eukprot:gene156-210_t
MRGALQKYSKNADLLSSDPAKRAAAEKAGLEEKRMKEKSADNAGNTIGQVFGQLDKRNMDARRMSLRSMREQIERGIMEEQGLNEADAKEMATNEQPDVTDLMMSGVQNNNPLYTISGMVAARWNKVRNSRRAKALKVFKFLDTFKDRSYKFFYFAVKCVEKVRMIQRNKDDSRRTGKSSERPIVRDFLLKQDEMAKEMNMKNGLDLGTKKISMKDRERKKFIREEMRYRRWILATKKYLQLVEGEMQTMTRMDSYFIEMKEYRQNKLDWEHSKFMATKVMKGVFDSPEPEKPPCPSQIPKDEKELTKMIEKKALMKITKNPKRAHVLQRGPFDIKSIELFKSTAHQSTLQEYNRIFVADDVLALKKEVGSRHGSLSQQKAYAGGGFGPGGVVGDGSEPQSTKDGSSPGDGTEGASTKDGGSKTVSRQNSKDLQIQVPGAIPHKRSSADKVGSRAGSKSSLASMKSMQSMLNEHAMLQQRQLARAANVNAQRRKNFYGAPIELLSVKAKGLAPKENELTVHGGRRLFTQTYADPMAFRTQLLNFQEDDPVEYTRDDVRVMRMIPSFEHATSQVLPLLDEVDVQKDFKIMCKRARERANLKTPPVVPVETKLPMIGAGKTKPVTPTTRSASKDSNRSDGSRKDSKKSMQTPGDDLEAATENRGGLLFQLNELGVAKNYLLPPP